MFCEYANRELGSCGRSSGGENGTPDRISPPPKWAKEVTFITGNQAKADYLKNTSSILLSM